MKDILVNLYIRLHPRLAHQLGRIPTDTEMSRYLGCTEEEICQIKQKLAEMSLAEVEDIYFAMEAI